jgi:hypothetical protein
MQCLLIPHPLRLCCLPPPPDSPNFCNVLVGFTPPETVPVAPMVGLPFSFHDVLAALAPLAAADARTPWGAARAVTCCPVVGPEAITGSTRACPLPMTRAHVGTEPVVLGPSSACRPPV